MAGILASSWLISMAGPDRASTCLLTHCAPVTAPSHILTGFKPAAWISRAWISQACINSLRLSLSDCACMMQKAASGLRQAPRRARTPWRWTWASRSFCGRCPGRCSSCRRMGGRPGLAPAWCHSMGRLPCWGAAMLIPPICAAGTATFLRAAGAGARAAVHPLPASCTCLGASNPRGQIMPVASEDSGVACRRGIQQHQLQCFAEELGGVQASSASQHSPPGSPPSWPAHRQQYGARGCGS